MICVSMIYGDDPLTPNVDEGINAGESFILRVWDFSTGEILEYPTSFDCWYNNNGGPMNGCGDYTDVYDFPVSTGGDGNTIVHRPIPLRWGVPPGTLARETM